MKVIAKMDNDRVLCEVNIAELAMLNGYRNQYDSRCNAPTISAVGAECNLNKMVNTSRFVRGLRTDTLIKTKEKLEMVINEIDAATELVSALEIFNVLSEDPQID